MTGWLITVGASTAAVIASLLVARRDDMRRQRSIDARIAARYRKPVSTRSWL